MSDKTDAAQAADTTVSKTDGFDDGLDSAFVDDSSPTPRYSGEISDPEPTPTPEPAPIAASDKPQEQTAEPQATDTPETPPTDTPAASNANDGAKGQPLPPAALAAVQEARAQMREAREQNNQLMQLLQAAQAPQQQQQPAPDPLAGLDFIDNPEGAAQLLQQHIARQLQAQRDELQKGFQQSMRGVMESQLAMVKPDYAEARQAFDQAAQSDPQLMAQYNAAPNPAMFAYQTGKNLQTINQYGNVSDLGALIEKVRADAMEQGRQALQAEITQATQTGRPPAVATATSLTTMAGAQSNASAPDNLDDFDAGLQSNFA